jgi:hypothetical protein
VAAHRYGVPTRPIDAASGVLSGVGFLEANRLFRHQDAENGTYPDEGVFSHHKAIL